MHIADYDFHLFISRLIIFLSNHFAIKKLTLGTKLESRPFVSYEILGEREVNQQYLLEIVQGLSTNAA